MKLKRRQITVLGGDKRSLALAEMFLADGMDLTVYRVDESRVDATLTRANTLEDVIDASPSIIGPLPFTNRDNQLSTPLYKGEITLEDIFRWMKQDQILLGGHILD